MSPRFEQLLQAARLQIIEKIDDTDGWTIYEVKPQDPFSRPLWIVTFASDATWEIAAACGQRIKALQKASGKSREIHALTWPSCVLTIDLSRLSGLVHSQTQQTIRTFLSTVAEQVLRVPYRHDDSMRQFVEPTITNGNTEEPAFEFLDRWLKDSSEDAPRVLVLVAPAAVGKTTLAEALTARLLNLVRSQKRTRRPLLLKRTTWSSLGTTNLTIDQLWRQAVDENYQTVMSHDDLTAFVTGGVLLPIFDGFDELCTLAGESFSPSSTMESLVSLAVGETSRLVVTTRDSYWNDAVPEEIYASPFIQIVELKPFNPNQASEYIRKRFTGPDADARRADAQAYLDRLQSYTEPGQRQLPEFYQRIAAVPLMVEMVCDAVEGGEPIHDPITENQLASNPVYTIVAALCRRERERRGLEPTIEQQFEVLSELAVYHPTIFDVAQLDTVLEVILPMLSKKQRLLFRNHALLGADGETHRRFRWDFVRDFIRGWALEGAMSSPTERLTVLEFVLGSEADGHGATLEHWAAIAQARDLYQPDRLQAAWRACAPQSTKDEKRRRYFHGARSALIHLRTRMACRVRPATPGERASVTRSIAEMIGADVFEDIHLEGGLSDLNLAGARFVRCTFTNSGFTRCDLDARTTFIECSFEGSFAVAGCAGASSVTWPRGAGVSASAQTTFLALADKSAGARVGREEVIDMFQQVLSRFSKGGRFTTVVEEDVLRGQLRNSAFARDVWDALRGDLVAEHTISGAGRNAGRHISRDVMDEVRGFLDNRKPGPRLNRLIQQVVEAWR